MPNTIASHLSPEDINKLHKMASSPIQSEVTEQPSDALQEPKTEQMADIDLSVLDDRWESEPAAIEHAETESVKITAPVKANSYTRGRQGSIEWSILSGGKTHELRNLSSIFEAMLASAREAEGIAQTQSHARIQLSDSEKEELVLRSLQIRHISLPDSSRVEKAKQVERSLQARRRMRNPFTPALKRIINKTAPRDIPVAVYENGMKLISQETVRTLLEQWLRDAALTTPNYYDLEKRITGPIVVERPVFEKTKLKEGEAFVHVAEGEKWVRVQLNKSSKFDPNTYSIVYYLHEAVPEEGTVLRVSEWGVVSGSSTPGGAEKSEAEEDDSSSRRSQIVSTDFISSEVVVGSDEWGRVYVPAESLRVAPGEEIPVEEPVDTTEPTPLVEAQHIDGEILKPDTELMIEAIDSDKPAEEIAHETGLDQARIEHLIELRTSWNGAYLAECKIENVTRKHPYIVCVLPEEIEGRTIEHAIAENAEYGNAVFVVRGEQEDWKTVLLDKTKRQAVDLGAKRVPHQGDWRDRVLDILTES